MTISTMIAVVALAMAAAPAALYLVNLRRYRPAPASAVAPHAADRPAVSVLIPARDEEEHIEQAVQAALASEGVDIEVRVLDDGSRDQTAEIVRRIARHDPRVHLSHGRGLPAGWNGKQHALWTLAQQATHPHLLFVDADVTLRPDALARMVAFLDHGGAALVSGIPQQRTGSWGERLVIPLIHFVLLGFLPMGRMRRSTSPSYASGIGQLFLARRDAYFDAGGHAGIRATRHDGIALPRLFRAAGHATDLVDATDLASCRMYHGFGEVWTGFVKNADEGLGRPALIVPVSALLLGGQLLPVMLLALSPWLSGTAVALAAVATALVYLPRVVSLRRFRQPLDGALLHPLGVLLMVAIQWEGLGRSLLGRRAAWKGRTDDADEQGVIEPEALGFSAVPGVDGSTGG